MSTDWMVYGIELAATGIISYHATPTQADVRNTNPKTKGGPGVAVHAWYVVCVCVREAYKFLHPFPRLIF